jgi:energy-coupling factor transport system permease protein
LRGAEGRLSARITIAVYFVLIACLFSVQNLSLHAFIAAGISLLVVVALPLRKAKSGLLPITFFLFFTFAGNVFFHPGRIVYNGFISVTDEGLLLAGVRTLRVFSMIFAAKLLTAVLSVEEMIRAIEGILRPLERIGVPVKDFFSIAGLTLQLFPTLMTYLLKEYREHMKNGETAGFRQRLRHMASFLMPVFVRSVHSPGIFFPSDPDAIRVREDT